MIGVTAKRMVPEIAVKSRDTTISRTDPFLAGAYLGQTFNLAGRIFKLSKDESDQGTKGANRAKGT
jgi:hypothetical protein